MRVGRVCWRAAATPAALVAVVLASQPAVAEMVPSGSYTTYTSIAGEAVTQSGAISVSGASSFEAGTLSVTLTNASNDFSGPVSATGSGIAITDMNDLIAGNLNAGLAGTITLTTGGGITQTGAITAGTLNIDAGGDVVLANAGNAIANLGTVEVTGDFTLTDTVALSIGSLTAEDVSFSVANGVTVGASGLISADTVTMGSGLLTVNGNIDGVVEIESGATLGGTGTVGDTTILSGGTLAPGNSIGTLTVDGDLTFDLGSTYAVEVDPLSSASDLVDVTGNIVINGGTVVHVGASGTYGLRSTYAILSADGTLSGSFDGASSDFAYLTAELAYDYGAGTVELELLRNDIEFASAAATQNQGATAAATESIGIAAANPVYDAVALLPDDEVLIQASFDALSGEIAASAASGLVEDSRLVRDAMNARLRDAHGAPQPEYEPLLSYAPSAADAFPAIVPATGGPVLWAGGIGSWGRIAGDGNAATLEHMSGGVLLGADAQVDAAQLGVLVGYGRSSFEADGRASSGSSDNYHVGAYSGMHWGDTALRAGLAYTASHVATERSVSIPGFSDELSAAYWAGTFQAFGELAYGIEVGDARFEPYANLAYVSVSREGYVEQGGPAALSVEAEDFAVPFTSIGARVEQALALGEAAATLTGALGWRHAFGDLTPLATQAFAAGDTFTVAGAPIAGDSLVVEAGLDIALATGASLNLSYVGQIAADAAEHGVSARLAVGF